jgi:hypothetical protein
MMKLQNDIGATTEAIDSSAPRDLVSPQNMLRALAEWIWRLAMLAAVIWVGWQVEQLREDLADPGVEPAEAAAEGTGT